MEVKVRGGYEVEVNKIRYKGGQKVQISEELYKRRPWVFDVVPVKNAPVAAPVEEEEEVTEEPAEVVAESVSEEDISNRAVQSPTLHRAGAKGKGKK